MMHSVRGAILSMACLPLLLAGCVSMSRFEAKEREAAQAKKELQAMRAERQKLGSELTSIQEERAVLERDLGEIRSKLVAAGEQAANRDTEIASLQKERADKEKEMARLQSEMAEKEQEVAHLQGNLGNKEQEIARLKSTYDDLVGNLKKEIEAGEVKVTQYKDLLTVNLVEKILFDSGKAVIKPRGLEILGRVGNILKGAADKQIRIEGHTDDVPIGPALAIKYPTNWELSTARATVVARYFQEKVGIPPERLAPAGFGEYRPVASNDSEEGRAQNRRIEIILAPLRVNPKAG